MVDTGGGVKVLTEKEKAMVLCIIDEVLVRDFDSKDHFTDEERKIAKAKAFEAVSDIDIFVAYDVLRNLIRKLYDDITREVVVNKQRPFQQSNG